ncbi:MAG TPA: GNAT family N-acetyltransferase [Acidimicrobiia bacterium]|nr:GNAT family N-acetyltransferase [Acidimicrobiia bacterium]
MLDPEIRVLDEREVETMLDWAADEGWNPGLHDGAAFRATDPHGFLGLFVDGELVVTASIVRYDTTFAFFGCYICRADRRGQGFGLALAQTALARADATTIGLDGVLEQEHTYERVGFVTAHRNIRFGGEPNLGAVEPGRARRLRTEDLAALERYERASAAFPAPRPAFLRHWISAPGTAGYAVGPPGRVDGYGVIRPCRSGHKIGPLFCDSRADAECLVDALVRSVDPGTGPVFLDVPAPHDRAVSLAEDLGLSPVFETARMYRGPEPALDLDHVFGITTFELG